MEYCWMIDTMDTFLTCFQIPTSLILLEFDHGLYINIFESMIALFTWFQTIKDSLFPSILVTSETRSAAVPVIPRCHLFSRNAVFSNSRLSLLFVWLSHSFIIIIIILDTVPVRKGKRERQGGWNMTESSTVFCTQDTDREVANKTPLVQSTRGRGSSANSSRSSPCLHSWIRGHLPESKKGKWF